MKDLLNAYKQRKNAIKSRLAEFKRISSSSEDDLFAELAFCLCTPQSKAKKCHEAVSILQETNVLFDGTDKEISTILRSRVRFHNNKAKYIVEARNKINGKLQELLKKENKEARMLLVKEIKGMSLKEASHFLRNTGNYENITILDRHILKNLKKYRVINKIPKTLTQKEYLEIEDKMLKFCKKIKIPAEDLDLLFWSEETGEIFK